MWWYWVGRLEGEIGREGGREGGVGRGSRLRILEREYISMLLVNGWGGECSGCVERGDGGGRGGGLLGRWFIIIIGGGACRLGRFGRGR